MATYKITTLGKILDGHDAAGCRSAIADMLKLSEDSPQLQAIFSGRELTLKKGLSQEQAEKYCSALAATGLECQSEAEDTVAAEPSLASAPSAAVPSSIPPPAATTQASENDFNPYQQPQAELQVEQSSGEFDLVDPKKLAAGSGWDWIVEGFSYLRANPGLWIGTVLVFWVLLIVVSMIPFVSIIANLFMPVFSGGFMFMAYKQFKEEDIEFGDMFAGFKNKLGTLVGVGALYLVGTILVVIIGAVLMFVMVGASAFGDMSGAEPSFDPLMMLLVMLVFMLLFIPLMMAYWFAPALVMLNDVGAVDAMRMSFRGCLRNMIPFLIYGLIGTVISIIAALPLFLGFLVWSPVIIASMFASYRQIYTES